MIDLASIELRLSGIDHAEGVAVEPDGTVWCGGEEGQIYRGPLEAEPRELTRTPGRPWGLCVDGEGGAYVCVTGETSGLYRVSGAGEVSLVTSGTPERPCVWPNFPLLLDDGTVLFTDSGEWGADEGCTYAVEAEGATRVADESAYRYPNGLALAPDGSYVAVVESTLPGVTALALGPSGTLGERRVLIELPGTVPDGVLFDGRGRMLVTFWTPDAVYVVENGRVEELVHDPQRFVLNSPTNAALVPGTRTLVVANYGERFLSVLELPD